jgi:hypothetical protein
MLSKSERLAGVLLTHATGPASGCQFGSSIIRIARTLLTKMVGAHGVCIVC